MKPPQTYVNKIRDGDGRPYRYRRWVYPTLFWLIRHPDRRDQPGLTRALIVEFVMVLAILGWIWLVTSRLMMWQRLNGSIPSREIIYSLMPAILVIWRYLVAKSLMHFAATIDLKAKICPACGYPLTPEDNDDSLTDAICSECGRRWTLPPNS